MKTKYILKPKIDAGNLGKLTKLNLIIDEINSGKYKNIVIETYPGVRLAQVEKQIISNIDKNFGVFWSEDYALQGKEFRSAIIDEMTEDRVFGKWTRREYRNFFNKKPIIKETNNIFYGTGASYLSEKADLIIYVDLPRWEIQKRYREKERVFFGGTLEEERISNFKRGYFIEWRMADKIKKDLLRQSKYYIDSTTNEFKVITSDLLFKSLNDVAHRPFRLVPYFDFGVWGGKWMQEKFDLGENEYSRWAWGFDGVPEENSIIISFENGSVEMPAINLVMFEPKNLLGERVWNRFGTDFPIRFDFLDTIKGGNLSLQVHPDFQYIRDKFWAPYTQEESYYILDVDESAKPVTYLGVKTNTNPDEFIASLNEAQSTNKMDVSKYVNSISVKKHDHLLHPSGVVHSSASGCMVLEISATPYIFTFKLWDWGRLGLNGKPRPINIEHGKNVIDYSFDTERTHKELINAFNIIRENDFVKEEKTGLHERQFIETRRITIKTSEPVIVHTNNSVNMLNLVEGEKVIIESVDNSFKALEVNYAETFIVPESCKSFKVTNAGSSNKLPMIIQAYVRTNG